MTETITQLPIDEYKDWILHRLDIKEQYRTIGYAMHAYTHTSILSSLSLCPASLNLLYSMSRRH